MKLIRYRCFNCQKRVRFGERHSPADCVARKRLVRSRLAAVLASAALALAACSTPTVTKVETVEVKVPVAVQPIRPDQVPEPPEPLGPRPQSLSATADVLLAKVCEFVAYAVQADPLLRISAGGQPAAVPKYPECE